ncbi:MAG: beta-galactosidase, partial [Lachnospiraceae bacterium]|nr:beta-galactosidase [Lachnospiraceae bacterium]
MGRKEFLFGAAYYDEYMPYDRIDTDFQMMKDMGFNVVRIAESTWSTWEPVEGVFDFTHLHRMLDAAKKYDIKVIVGTPTYAIPAWLHKKHPDVLSVTKNGPELYGRRQNIDISNPHFLKYAERIIRKLMEEAKDHPQVIGYQLDNETRSAGAASAETQKIFVERMKKKYPDLEAFNLEFGLNYWSNRIGRWEDFPDVRGTINGSLSA